MAKENERISFEKIENGFIITHSYHDKKGQQYNFVNKRFYAKTAKETQDKMVELQKQIKIK